MTLVKMCPMEWLEKIELAARLLMSVALLVLIVLLVVIYIESYLKYYHYCPQCDRFFTLRIERFDKSYVRKWCTRCDWKFVKDSNAQRQGGRHVTCWWRALIHRGHSARGGHQGILGGMKR